MRNLWIIGLLLVSGEAAAQPPGRPGIAPDEVQRTAEEILSSPEFREFQRLREKDAPAAGDGGADQNWPRANPAPPPQARPNQTPNQRPRDEEKTSGTRSGGHQPPGSKQEQPYPGGWRGGIEGGRESVRPDEPRDADHASPSRETNAGSQGKRRADTADASDASQQPADTPARESGQQSPQPGEPRRQERDPAGGSRPPLASGNDTADRRGAQQSQRRTNGAAAPGSRGGRQADPGADADAQPTPRSSGSNRPFGDGWRGGEQGGRRSLERMAERGNGENGARAGGGRSGVRRNGNGSFNRREGSARTGSRRGGSDRSSRANRSRSSPESSQSSSARDSGSSRTSAAAGPLGSAIASLFHVLAWIFLAGVCGMIAFLIYRAICEFERAETPALAPEGAPPPGDLDTDTAPGEVAADVYVARAREFALAGQYRDAVAQLLLGAMSHIERAGLIRYRRGLTLRDYLRAARRAKPQFTGMKSMVRVYEPLGFGRRAATREHFETSLAGYERGFQGGVSGEW